MPLFSFVIFDDATLEKLECNAGTTLYVSRCLFKNVVEAEVLRFQTGQSKIHANAAHPQESKQRPQVYQTHDALWRPPHVNPTAYKVRAIPVASTNFGCGRLMEPMIWINGAGSGWAQWCRSMGLQGLGAPGGSEGSDGVCLGCPWFS